MLRDRKKLARNRRLKTPVYSKLAAVAGPGKWNQPFDLPVFAINSVVLHTGKVMIWAYPFGNSPDGTRDLPPARNASTAYLWNPSQGTGPASFKEVAPPKVCPNNPSDPGACTEVQKKPANIWCSGQALLADGRVLVTGGNLEYETPTSYYKGLNLVFTFDPNTETWTQHESMAHGRWYPTQTTMPDGRVLIMSGADESGNLDAVHNNPDVEIFDPSAPLGQEITNIGARGTAGHPPVGETYPHVFTMPNRTIVVAGPNEEDSWGLRAPFGLANWFDFPWDRALLGQRYAGNAVIDPADPNKITLIGGGNGGCSPVGNCTTVPEATTATLDSNDPSGWSQGPSLNQGRAHANTVLLPNGGMATVGGGVGATGNQAVNGNGQWQACPVVNGAVPECPFWRVELYDPDTKRWTLGPAQTENRAYHSTAVLLPDGGVLSAGDDLSGRGRPYAGFNGDTGEVYEPEYMSRSRPTIASAPTQMSWGLPYTVSGTNISQVVLMAPSAVTHGNDMNQRRLVLNYSDGQVTAPVDGFTAPPGYYMMFALDANGVPSVANWVHLGNLPPEPPPLTPPTEDPLNMQPGTTPPGTKSPARTHSETVACGNLNIKTNRFYRISKRKGITAFNVTVFRTNCGFASTLIAHRRLKGYIRGKRSARAYTCVSRRHGRHLRAISCRSGSRVVKWRVKS